MLWSATALDFLGEEGVWNRDAKGMLSDGESEPTAYTLDSRANQVTPINEV